MASSSGNSMSSQMRSSGSERDLVEMDERKRKRMQSNRESARRSRMRKQKHLNELSSRVDQLKRENDQIVVTMESTHSQYVHVEAENSVLRAQMSELSQRLESLNEIVNYMNALGGVGNINNSYDHMGLFPNFGTMDGYNGNNVDPWTMQGCFIDQPCYFVGDMLQC